MLLLVMLVVGLIDIQHMQSVIFFSSKIATILVIWKHSDRETPSLPVFNSYQRG